MSMQTPNTYRELDLFADAFPSVSVLDAKVSERGLAREQNWRKIPHYASPKSRASIFASHWLDSRRHVRREETVAPSDDYVIAIAMKATRLKFSRGSRTLFDGVMPSGTLHVTGPGQNLEAVLHAPCEFVHLFVSTDYLQRRGSADGEAAAERGFDLSDFTFRDSVVEQLARSLIDAGEFYDEFLADSVGQTIVTRLLRRRMSRKIVSANKVQALPRWRLKRVQDYIEDNAQENLKLADLAHAAGLSRMHFAAQFRAATGYSPCEYLRVRRIERAKDMLSNNEMPLVEVALSAGFQAQAHFSSVFRRVTGKSPGQWRRARQEGMHDIAG